MKNIYTKICKQCGASFQGGPRAWFCPTCRSEREKIRKAKYRRVGFARHLGDTDICKVCGKPYVILGGGQLYCPKCAKDAVKEIDRKQGLMYYGQERERINQARKAARRKKAYCIVCGHEINPAGGRQTCPEHEKQLKKEKCQDMYVGCNIRLRRNTYIVYANFQGKSYYIKGLRDYDKAIKLRDYAAVRSKQSDFMKWLKAFRDSGRDISKMDNCNDDTDNRG